MKEPMACMVEQKDYMSAKGRMSAASEIVNTVA